MVTVYFLRRLYKCVFLFLLLSIPSSLADVNFGNSSTFTAADKDFQSTILTFFNKNRRDHNASALVWNDGLARNASVVAERCDLDIGPPPPSYTTSSGYPNLTASLQPYATESKTFDWKHKYYSTSTSRLTQMLWKATTSVGCAAYECNGQGGGAPGWLLVCGWDPPGNERGGFGANVDPVVSAGAAAADAGGLGWWVLVAVAVGCGAW